MAKVDGARAPKRGFRRGGSASTQVDEPAADLRIAGLNASYGTAKILNAIDLDIEPGSSVAILGRNGAGKSTLFKAIVGLPEVSKEGSIRLASEDLAGLRPDQIARLGVQLVPEDRRVLAELSVRENLELAALPSRVKRGAGYLDGILKLFPEMQAFLNSGGGELSGGQQQMVAVARALVSRPRLLLLDEPSTGLAPVVVDRLLESLRSLNTLGATILVAEQNVRFALAICDQVVVLEMGSIVYRGSREDLEASPDLRQRYLEVS